MNKQLRTIVLVDSPGLASHTVRESWRRLHIANPLRIFSSCSQALSFICDATAAAVPDGTPQVGAVVLDHSAREQDGLQLIKHVRRDPAVASLPLLIYAADIRPLRECTHIHADAFVRRPMALKLIHELDSLCGLSKTYQAPTVGTARLRPSHCEELGCGDSAGRHNRKEVVSSAAHTNPITRMDVTTGIGEP